MGISACEVPQTEGVALHLVMTVEARVWYVDVLQEGHRYRLGVLLHRSYPA